MRPLLLACILVFALFSMPAAASAPRSSAQTIESDPCLLPQFGQLLLRAHREMEVAAFITDHDGSLALLVWPVMAWVRRQEFHGTIPPMTLGLVHTHPHDEIPSEQDIREAERVMLPSFVVTHRSVWVIDPDTEPRVRRIGVDNWFVNIPSRLPRQCRPLQMAR